MVVWFHEKVTLMLRSHRKEVRAIIEKEQLLGHMFIVWTIRGQSKHVDGSLRNLCSSNRPSMHDLKLAFKCGEEGNWLANVS